jgi:O-antigen/teichoic acid export membrane protein
VSDSDIAAPAPPITRGLLGVTAAGWLGNILSYLLLLAAARKLGADDYASLVTLINLLLVGSVPSFALQAVGARRMATGQSEGLWQAGLAIGAGAGVIILLISPLLRSFLHLPSLFGLIFVAICMPATAVQGLCQGVVQGEQRFARLAAITFIGIAGKSFAGLVGLLLSGSATITLAAIAVGVTIAGLVSALALPELRRNGFHGWRRLGPLITESGHASHAYGVFLLLSVADVLLARHVLPTRSAAVYAAGSILTKATLWLPQSVANVLFASLTDAERHRRVFARAASSIAVLAAGIAAGCWLLGSLATKVVAGSKYPELSDKIWLFAVLGGCLAVTQFTLVAGLAVRSVGVTALIWLTVLAEAVGVFSLGHHPAVSSVIELMCLINLVSAGCAAGLRLRSH